MHQPYIQQPPQQQMLPWPVDQPRDHGLWSEHPLQDPSIPLPNVGITQEFQWIIPMAIGTVVAYLQQNCRNGAVSTFAYNLFANNRYQNAEFQMMSRECIEYVVFRVRSQGNTNLQDEVVRSAASYAKVAVATCTNHYPALLQYLAPIAQTDIQNVLTAWNQVKSLMRAPAQQQQHIPGALPGHGGPGGIPNGSAFLSGGSSLVAPAADDRRGAYSSRQKPVADGVVAEQPAGTSYVVEGVVDNAAHIPAPSAADNQAFIDTPLKQLLEFDPLVPEVADLDVNSLDFDSRTDAGGSFSDQGSPADTDDKDDSVEAGYPEKDDPVRVIALTPSAFETSKIKKSELPEEGEWIDKYLMGMVGQDAYLLEVVKFLGSAERPWDVVAAEAPTADRTRFLLTPAIFGNTQVTRSAHQPHREFPYNPQTHVLFHAVKEGTLEPVYEYICAMEDSMNYLNHEHDEALRQQEEARTNKRDNIGVDWSTLYVIEPRVAKDTPGQDQQQLVKLDERSAKNGEGIINAKIRSKAVIIPKCQPNAGVEEILQRIDAYRRTNRIPALDTRDCYEAYGTHRRKFFMRSEDQGDLKTLVVGLSDKGGYEGWKTFLAEYQTMVGKDRFYNAVNDILSARLNDVLYHNLGITIFEVDNFAEDLPVIIDEMRGYGPNQFAAFEGFLNFTCSQLQLTIEEEQLIIHTQFALVFLDHSLQGMGFFPFVDGRTSGAISQTTHGELHQAMYAVLNRAQLLNNKQHAPTYVVSSDDRIVQLHRSAWDANYISVALLSQRDFH